MVRVHECKATDFFLRSLGFVDRAYLQIVSHDDRVFYHGGIAAKPDWVIYDRARRQLFIIDYKNRLAGRGGATAYESWQVTIFGLVVATALANEWQIDMTYTAGLLYANDERIEVTPNPKDIQRIIAAVPQAQRALAANDQRLLNKPVAASKLAKFILGQPMDETFDPEAAAEGTRAHAKIVEFSPKHRKWAGAAAAPPRPFPLYSCPQRIGWTWLWGG